MADILWNTKAYWEQSHKKEGIPWLLQTLENQQDIEDPLINAWLLVARAPTTYLPQAYLREKSDRYKTIVTLVQEHAQWLNDHPQTFNRVATVVDCDKPCIQSASVSSKGMLALKLIQCQQIENTWEPLKQKYFVQCVVDWIDAETLACQRAYPGLTIRREDVLVLMTNEMHANNGYIPAISTALCYGQEHPLSAGHYRHIQRIDAILENDVSFDTQYPYMTASLKLYRPATDGSYQQHNAWMARHATYPEDTALAMSKLQHSKPEKAPHTLLYRIASQQYPIYSKIDGAIQTLRDVTNTLNVPDVWSKNATGYLQNSGWITSTDSSKKFQLWIEELNDISSIQTLIAENKPQILPDLEHYDMT
jgi:hypothetical protein